ncbi:DoxX family protein [Maribacter sp. 2-571]|uniref:DoxX family protein n=1 Tax=Maribacter sp. 2-571 TaxID=3417569 RepID=UPI003D34B582
MNNLRFPPKTDSAALLLRLFLGGMFLLHGIGKVFIVGLDMVVIGFLERGFPAWTAYAATLIELVGGIPLLLGIYTRISCLLLLPVAFGIFYYHLPYGWVFHNLGGGYEYPQLIIIAILALFWIDGGKYALQTKNQ